MDRDIASLSAPTMPTSAEEALALWIHGQQHRNGSLQYSALSPELKEIALAKLHKQGWVTGGSSPSNDYNRKIYNRSKNLLVY